MAIQPTSATLDVAYLVVENVRITSICLFFFWWVEVSVVSWIAERKVRLTGIDSADLFFSISQVGHCQIVAPLSLSSLGIFPFYLIFFFSL